MVKDTGTMAALMKRLQDYRDLAARMACLYTDSVERAVENEKNAGR